MIEYLVGGSRPKYELTPNSVSISTILFTEIYSKIIFHTFYEENTNNVCAIEIDNDIMIGTKYNESKALSIEFEEDKNYFDSMVFQQVIKQAGDNKSLYWSNITYLEIVYQGTKYTMGELKPVKLVELHDKQGVLLKYDFLEPIALSNPFYISGINIHNAGICALQIIEFQKSEHLDFKNIKTQFSYNQGKVGIIEAKSEMGEFDLTHMIMDHNVVCYENIEPIQLLQLLYERMRGWTNGRSVISTYYPKFISLIDKAIIKRDYDVIHSVLRLDRYLKSLIQRDIVLNHHKKYQEDLGLTVKLYQIWHPLAQTMELIQKIHNADVELNCYQVAYLSNTNMDYMYASVTILCQMSLLVLLGLSLLEVNIDKIFPLYEGRIIIPIIFIFTHFVVKKQSTNTMNFRELFQDMNYTFLGVCDLFSNVGCAGLVLVLNFFVLAFSDSLIDIVLNSLAALFIIELDDSMVFISNDNKDDLFRQKVIYFLNQQLKNIPNIYFTPSSWKNKNMYKLNHDNVYVDKELCEIKSKKDPNDKNHLLKSVQVEVV